MEPSLEESVVSTVPLHINQFPNEIMEHIFGYLNLEERKYASLVCHRWNLLAFGPHLLSEVVLQLTRPALEELKQTNRSYRNINCRNLHFLTNYLPFLGPNLEGFQCKESIFRHQLREILKLAPNLKSLNIKAYYDNRVDSEPMPVMNKLVDLNIRGDLWFSEGFQTEEIFPNLSRMSVDFSTLVGNTRVYEVLKNFSFQLKYLSFDKYDKAPVAFDQSCFPHLNSIRMNAAPGELRLKSFFSQFVNSNLTNAHIDCALEDDILEAIAKICDKLEKLHVNVFLIRGPGFASLVQLANLKYLAICGPFHKDFTEQYIKPNNTVVNLEVTVCRTAETYFILLPDIIDKVIRSFLKMKRLYFNKPCGMFCVDSPSALTALVNVEELIVNGIPNITNNLPGSSNLKRLHIYNSRPYQMLDILSLLERMPALRLLDFDCDLNSELSDVFHIRRKFPHCLVQRNRKPEIAVRLEVPM
ncbi:uncharacterized protein LOC129751926 [Uranotaenia lowii]|uniref:uncharacterized protein LOC129751926 n=1 Tax=Uranotaenia lowii TaxID=190385 RepID=UPI002479FB75|nr:uncharacterized protein LOC129751926 [Uranotaenia lowii]